MFVSFSVVAGSREHLNMLNPSFKLPEMIVEAKILEWTAAPIMNEAEQFSKTYYFFVFVSNIH